MTQTRTNIETAKLHISLPEQELYLTPTGFVLLQALGIEMRAGLHTG
jgi:hypothetical protein